MVPASSDISYEFARCDDYILSIDLVTDFTLSDRRVHDLKIVTTELVINFAVFILSIVLG